jgi:hypothetical protein
MSKAQDIYRAVEKLAAEGRSKKDAHEIVAKQHGMRPSSIRGACYQARVQLGEVGPRRVKETTTEGAVASAVEALERARDAIDEEVTAAKDRARESEREAKVLSETATARKAEIESKIKALTA